MYQSQTVTAWSQTEIHQSIPDSNAACNHFILGTNLWWYCFVLIFSQVFDFEQNSTLHFYVALQFVVLTHMSLCEGQCLNLGSLFHPRIELFQSPLEPRRDWHVTIWADHHLRLVQDDKCWNPTLSSSKVSPSSTTPTTPTTPNWTWL